MINDAAHLAEQGDLDLIHLAGGVPDWYRKFGYEQAGSRYRYHFDRGNVELLPKLDCEVVTGVEEPSRRCTNCTLHSVPATCDHSTTRGSHFRVTLESCSQHTWTVN